ncbi:uncharacterized protein SCODWIG_03315 [Saccharomycodes ludwigii]|uniref:Regulator of phospholipase D SRF1 n=1 Tax=Saccharomycodes ludwigii TaxID=36035 RepID=A0A376BAI1_9ASCO|nr:hypothetical protein SCDLUD_000288 [Saccharomycodes ludwigii]KAH3902704.1 hypothetical protein SCDLUD_000288 [Saccharomycodes ludwigii]SSD61554.1 uncharacterized protein SCODWIG_03315 [Saccharomycodes ludwigii]
MISLDYSQYPNEPIQDVHSNNSSDSAAKLLRSSITNNDITSITSANLTPDNITSSVAANNKDNRNKSAYQNPLQNTKQINTNKRNSVTFNDSGQNPVGNINNMAFIANTQTTKNNKNSLSNLNSNNIGKSFEDYNQFEKDNELSLNPYSLAPSTIPPFALEANFNKLQLKNPQRISDADMLNRIDPRIKLKDPFLVSNNNNAWVVFTSKIGSNTSYSYDKKVHYKKGAKSFDTYKIDKNRKSNNGVEHKNNSSSGFSVSRKSTRVAPTSQPSSSSLSYSSLSKGSSSSNECNLEKLASEVFVDLEGEWGGKKRLEAVLNGPDLATHQFKNDKERRQWNSYAHQIRDLYYSNDKKKRSSQRFSVGNKEKLQEYLNRQFSERNGGRPIFNFRKKRKLRPYLKRLLFDNRYFLLSLRLSIGVFCVVSLALAVRIFDISRSDIESIDFRLTQQPSTIMTICVSTIALAYIIYIAYDEFTGQPLGLRDPLGKLRLLLLDLLFIIFSSANLALSFNTMLDHRWACHPLTSQEIATKDDLPKIGFLCRKQKALSSFLFVVLFFWISTFTLSIVRVVSRVSGQPD